MAPTTSYRIAQVLLTLSALEFFGPIVRDTGDSHLMNAEWVGHARVHLMWLLGYLFFSGLANLYFIWLRRPRRISHLYLSCLWQGCNLAGFWVSVLFVEQYRGMIVDPRYHHAILGIDENVFAFSVLSAIVVGTTLFLKLAVEPVMPRET
jgi:hypothetical protein